MFVITAISGAVGWGGAIGLGAVLQASLWWHIALCGLVLILIEIGFILWYLHAMDKTSIQKILKGGAL
jgi:hypothetical protein